MSKNFNPGIKWGIIAGIVSILLNIIFWVSSREIFFGFVPPFVIAFVFSVAAVLAGIEKKKAQGGQITFKEVLQPVFLTFVIGGLFAGICTYVFYNFVDPTIPEQAKQHAIATTDRMLHSLGVPEDDIDKQLDGLKELEYDMKPGKALLTYFALLIRYFVLAAIISVILRNKRSA